MAVRRIELYAHVRAARCSFYSLLATRYSLLATRYSLLATRYSLLATRYSLLATRYSLLAQPPRPDRLPDAFGRRRHVDVADAVFRERIDDRVHDRDQRAGAARFAAALDAERVGLGRHRMMLGDESRHVGGARHSV